MNTPTKYYITSRVSPHCEKITR